MFQIMSIHNVKFIPVNSTCSFYKFSRQSSYQIDMISHVSANEKSRCNIK